MEVSNLNKHVIVFTSKFKHPLVSQVLTYAQSLKMGGLRLSRNANTEIRRPEEKEKERKAMNKQLISILGRTDVKS